MLVCAAYINNYSVAQNRHYLSTIASESNASALKSWLRNCMQPGKKMWPANARFVEIPVPNVFFKQVI